MSKRSYHQFCPLAYSLDVVGERWTLLIVRELLFGPRRYTDLINGLPGIGTNLLARRLKDLEQAGVISQRALPPPASSTVYELTARGRGLQPVIAALADWGQVYLQMPPPDEDFMGPVPLMGALRMLFNPATAQALHLTCEFRVFGEVFHATVTAGMLEVATGSASAPDLVVRSRPKTLLYRLAGDVAADDIEILTGNAGDFERFAAAFGPLA
jgi:DNA-binding HxlR family transcriptional regulator